jgi:ribosomal-protein-alanine N-acetyltransferase
MAKAIPTFETKRLILREVTATDFLAYDRHFIDYEVIRELSSLVPWPYPANGVRDYFETVVFPNQGITRWLWGICLKSNPTEVIGGVELVRDGKPENRGFWLGRKFWGQGIMTEAVLPIMDYAFDELQFEKLIFSNALGNEKSRNIKLKTGARLIGARPAKFVNPDYTTAETWELTRDEWIHRKSNSPTPN